MLLRSKWPAWDICLCKTMDEVLVSYIFLLWSASLLLIHSFLDHHRFRSIILFLWLSFDSQSCVAFYDEHGFIKLWLMTDRSQQEQKFPPYLAYLQGGKCWWCSASRQTCRVWGTKSLPSPIIPFQLLTLVTKLVGQQGLTEMWS
jgi:hypothetical protein